MRKKRSKPLPQTVFQHYFNENENSNCCGAFRELIFLQHVFVVVFCYVALGAKHLASLQPPAWLPPGQDPFRSLAIRAPQLETTLMFHSNQLSSVTFSGGVSLRLQLFLGLHITARATPSHGDGEWRTESARAWPRSGATPRRGVRKLHSSLAAQLAADGTLFPRVY